MFCLPPARDMVLFLDIDGTLLDFAATPSDVIVPAKLIDDLMDLRLVLDDALAFVSGRILEDVDSLFAPLRMPGAFSHGGEFRYPDFRIIRKPASSERVCIAVDKASVWSRQHAGILVENKGDALALHYRNAPTKESLVRQHARELLQLLGGDYHLLEGNAVVEIKPGDRSKGHAICELLKRPQWSDRVPVFVGDDVTDEDGFKVVNAMGGLSIKVGEGDTQATGRLPGPHAVRQWLRSLVSLAS